MITGGNWIVTGMSGLNSTFIRATNARGIARTQLREYPPVHLSAIALTWRPDWHLLPGLSAGHHLHGQSKRKSNIPPTVTSTILPARGRVEAHADKELALVLPSAHDVLPLAVRMGHALVQLNCRA